MIGNIWAVLHDEVVYPELESFIPEWFLEEGVPDSLPIAFGFGRRCVEFLPFLVPFAQLRSRNTMANRYVDNAQESPPHKYMFSSL